MPARITPSDLAGSLARFSRPITTFICANNSADEKRGKVNEALDFLEDILIAANAYSHTANDNEIFNANRTIKALLGSITKCTIHKVSTTEQAARAAEICRNTINLVGHHLDQNLSTQYAETLGEDLQKYKEILPVLEGYEQSERPEMDATLTQLSRFRPEQKWGSKPPRRSRQSQLQKHKGWDYDL